MKRISVLLTATAIVATACSESPAEPASEIGAAGLSSAASAVSSAADLQAALDVAASTPGPSTVVVRGVIHLEDPLTYVSSYDLEIVGRGARLIGPDDPIAEPTNSGARVGEPTVGDALQILGAPDLTVRNVRFEEQTGHGIYFELPSGAAGTVHIRMTGVRFTGQGLSALWYEDQESERGVIESAAGVHLGLERVQVLGTGFAADEDGGCPGAEEEDGCPWADFDGMRINEGGDGGLDFAFRNVRFLENAGDGIEFDETGAGHVTGAVVRGMFDRNGSQPQFLEDLEDGFDIDEAGPGSVDLSMELTTIDQNIDEGLDLDEEGEGDIVLALHQIGASGNQDDNIKLSEDADREDEPDSGIESGGILIDISGLRANGALDGDGVKLEEFGRGRILGAIDRSQIRQNDSDGLEAEQVNQGADVDGALTLTRTQIRQNGTDIDLENVVINP